MPCPARSEWSCFLNGQLPQADVARLAAHVEACPTCEAHLQELDARADSLVGSLRQPAADEPAVPEALLAIARAARTESGSRWLPETGQGRLGKFELLEELGMGSFGHVFRARDPELDRTVAIKILRAGRFASSEEVDRFLREARSAAQLKHPGIVALYDTGQTEDGTWFLVEEFIPGSTLAQRLAAGRFMPRQAAELVEQVALALDYAHTHGVIHRDIKPSNILLDLEGRPHLMDFGLAKRETDDTPVTVAGQVLGTPAYMSPEQARGESHDVDARSDLYSLGVVLYEVLTGERPFRGTRRMLLLQVLQDEPRPPRKLNDKVPRDLETICLKAMAKAPARRYTTGRELAADLRRYLNGEPIQARPMGGTERLWRWCQRNPVPAGLLLAVTLGSAFGLGQLSRLSTYLVQSTALESATQQAEMLETVNNFYSDQIVDRVGAAGVPATHDYHTRKGAIPLPATMTIELGKIISEQGETGVQVRLFSDYPFRTRKDGGPHDDFEREALARLRQNPDQHVHRFEDYQGKPSLRYALARRMRDTCIRCHNFHPDSMKRDWKEGDVRGVLEIIRPLDRDIERTRRGLRGTFVLMGVLSGSLLLLSLLVLVAGNRRRALTLPFMPEPGVTDGGLDRRLPIPRPPPQR